MDRPRRIFVAGSTGATGQTLLRLAGPDARDLVPHQRPRPGTPAPADARVAVVDLGEHGRLVEAMRGSTTVVQLIGTMRSRFARGDTYETSDIGTTRQLVAAAKEAGVDHVVLLSSVGAGRPLGAYLQAKARAEAIVRESGLSWTILRPSAFVGGGHRPPAVMGLVTRLPGLSKYRPIPIEDLARAILHVARTRSSLGLVLEGDPLWAVVEASKASR